MGIFMMARDVGVVTCVLSLLLSTLLHISMPLSKPFSNPLLMSSPVCFYVYFIVFFHCQFHCLSIPLSISLSVSLSVSRFIKIVNIRSFALFTSELYQLDFINETNCSQIPSNVAAFPHYKFEDNPPSDSTMASQQNPVPSQKPTIKSLAAVASQQDRVPSQKATVKSLATGTRSATFNHAHSEVVERIKKCLARGNHANANENEAKSAIKMASKIMHQHNITQAEVMEGEDDAQRLERGGLSTVNIGARTQDRQVVFETWVVDLRTAICTFFDCQALCSPSSSSIEWIFFGVAEHTVSAAMAFEMTHNLIQSWALPIHDICARDSYCRGVANGLKDIAKAEQRAVERAAKENEAKSGPSEDQITSEPNKTEWASSMQLVSYRQNVLKIAEDVLKANNLKYHRAKVEKMGVMDKKQYAQGVEDSRKINVRGARIENGRA